jgi:OmpA-OmpF porin, OOP family
MKFMRFVILVYSAVLLMGCAGTNLEGRSVVIGKLVRTAEKNGAYKCAPKELAQAKTHLEFSLDEMSQGKYFQAEKLLQVADDAANEAIRKSPPERCAKKLVVVKIKVTAPVLLVVKKLDTDGDGILDTDDKCPNVPEDKDGFEDSDGCPDTDNDKDGILDIADKCPGVDKDKDNNFKDVAEDKDGFEDSDGCPDFDNDKDGLNDKVDKCPGVDKDEANNFKDVAEDKDNFEDDDGCPDFDNDKDGIYDAVDKCPNVPETKNGYKDEDGCPDELKLIKVTVHKIELKKKIYFAYNKSKIKKKSFALLNEIISVLKARLTMTLRIEGHTDNRGGRRYNLRLSRKRARSVRKYLSKHGIDPSRLISKGYGLKKPIAKNNTRAGRSKNRRVEFVITHQ